MTSGPVNSAWYRFVAWAARTLFFRLMGGCRILGIENVPRTGPVIIAPVHVSELDPPLVGSTCPRILRFMAKEELFRNVAFGRLIASVGAFPVKRGEGDAAAIRQSLKWLADGEAVLVFPEGGRNDGRTMNPLLPGVAVLAKRSGALVVPVGLGGTAQMWPKGAKRPRRGKSTVLYGRPFTYEEAVGDGDRDAFSSYLADRIVEECRAAGFEIRSGDGARGRSESRRSRTRSSTTGPETA